MSEFQEVYARMLFAANARTQSELAHILGLRQSSISDAKKRNSIPADWYIRLYDACSVKMDWLRFGEGPVFASRRGQEAEGSGGNLLREKAEESLKLQHPDTLPILSPVQLPDGSFPEVGGQRFPHELKKEGVRVFRILDASMAPRLNRGGLVAVAEEAVEDGDVAAFRFSGRMLFRCFQHTPEGVVLKAEAPDAMEYVFSEEEWRRVYEGKAVWAFQPL